MNHIPIRVLELSIPFVGFPEHEKVGNGEEKDVQKEKRKSLGKGRKKGLVFVSMM